jgi:predicted Zn-dependent protease
MPKVFALLDRVSRASSAGRVPNWLSSHPDPGDRVSRSRQRIEERQYGAGSVGGPSYVGELDGLVYGNDPRQGYFERGVFYHPELRFQMRFPQGWKAANEATRVAAVHPENVALLELTMTDKSSPEEAANDLERSQGITSRGSRRVNVHGMSAVRSDFQVARQNASPLEGIALFPTRTASSSSWAWRCRSGRAPSKVRSSTPWAASPRSPIRTV